MSEYTPTELAAALEHGSEWLYNNVHSSYGCIGCELCTIRSMMDIAAVELRGDDDE